MSADQEYADKAVTAILAWCARNNSFTVQTPGGRYYALFFEPDGEGPRMQFMGSNLVRAYAFVLNHTTNRYQ